MSTVTPIVSPAYVNQANVEHRDIVPVVLVNPATGQLVLSGDSAAPLLQVLSDSLVANTVKTVILPTVVTYLRLQNTNTSGDIVVRFNDNPIIGDPKSITLAPGAVLEINRSFRATDLRIIKLLLGDFNLIVA